MICLLIQSYVEQSFEVPLCSSNMLTKTNESLIIRVLSPDCPYDRINGSVGPGCADSNGAKCHEQCVAGCTVPDDDKACYGCLHYNHDVSFSLSG